MGDVAESGSGLASGIVNTSFVMGGALGLSVRASLAATISGSAPAGGFEAEALNAGYRLAFGADAVFAFVAFVAAAVGALLLPVPGGADPHGPARPAAPAATLLESA